MRALRFAQRLLPRISRTERIALQSGQPGVERFAFDGSLSLAHLRRYDERRAVADSPAAAAMLPRAAALVRTVDETDVLHRRVTPAEHPFWAHAKAEGFFGLIVPEEYGGTPLRPSELSRLLQRLASCSASVPVHVMVPASLGPAELLAHYGTDAQRAHFLPRLARGAIPCFGLTSTDAGSDAAGSMTDTGTVYAADDGTLRLRVRCRKRYITLAPVADVVGLAFKTVDPDGLFAATHGRAVDGEISLALVERGRAGLTVGAYIDPLGVGFANGTVDADLDLALDDLIGGAAGAGEGWKFLMEALAAGRGIALPAGAAGSSKMLSNAVGAYAVARRQFHVPIGTFEGVQEKLADMALKTLEIDSLVALMNATLDAGERPPVLSAVLKQRCTELGRDVVLHAMDLVAGSAICVGPQNFVAPAYLSNPIGITVEGSNTMTRSLLIFGQGVVRSHPHLLAVLDALENDDADAFGRAARRMVADVARLALVPRPGAAPLERFVHFFALSANASLLLGGQLKRREFLSGRYADLLSYLLSGVAVEWHGGHRGLRRDVLDAAAARNLHRLEACARELVDNHPHRWLHRALYARTVGSARHADASDAAKARVAAELMCADSPLRRTFDQDVLLEHPNVRRLDAFLRASSEERERLLPEILRVDLYECRDGRLSPHETVHRHDVSQG